MEERLRAILDQINDDNRNEFLLALEDYVYSGRKEYDFQIMTEILNGKDPST